MEDSLQEPLLSGPEPEEELQCGRHWTSKVSFYWAGRILTRGNRRPLQAADLYQLEEDLLPHRCSGQLWESWTEERNSEHLHQTKGAGKPSLLRATARTYGWAYLRLGGLKFGSDALNFAGPLLLNQLITFLQTSSDNEQHQPASAYVKLLPTSKGDAYGYILVGLLALASFIKAILNTQYTYHQGRMACQLRASLTCMVFKKTLLVGSADMVAFSSGAVQTLMSVDADRVVNLCLSVHELWSLPVQIGIALYLLWTQVQGAFVAGLMVVLLLIPLNRWLALRIQAASVGMMGHKDARIKATAELLRGIRQIKASAWETPFTAQIQTARAGELQELAVCKYLDALCVFFWAATSLLFSLATFGAFILMGHDLTAATVFTSLALFNVLIAPLNNFPWVINGIVEAVVSVQRLQGFLVLPEIKHSWAYSQVTEPAATPSTFSFISSHPASAIRHAASNASQQDIAVDMDDSDLQQLPLLARFSDEDLQQPQAFGSSWNVAADGDAPAPSSSSAPVCVRLQDASFMWARATHQQLMHGHVGQLPLSHITLHSAPGNLTVVLGSPGSGKSALLLAILGEMVHCGGGAHTQGSVAFASQEPWIMSASIRDNILFGRPFHPQRYADVLHACALQQDTAGMPAGDLTPAGDRGAALSGGQRMRIALARALYEDSDVYLLDDVLAAVDAHVAAWITERAICGPLLRGKTCIMCTHSDMLTQHADWLVHMRAGSITSVTAQPQPGATDSGNSYHQAAAPTMSQSQRRPSLLSRSLQDIKAPVNDSGDQAGWPAAGSSSSSGSKGIQDVCEGDDEEHREAGHVRWQVHVSYMRATGWLMTAIILSSLILMQATRNGSDLWLSYWVANVEEDFRSHPLLSEPPRPPLPPSRILMIPQIDRSMALPITPLRMHPFLPAWKHPNEHQHHAAQKLGMVEKGWGLGWAWLPPETSFYFSVLLLIAAANSLFTMARAFSFAAGGLAAAERLHAKLLEAVSQVPMAFFDATPTGRILNRFSSDTVLADDSLPFILNIFLANAAAILGVTTVLLICQPLLLVLYLPVAVLYTLLQGYYQSTAREVRRLTSVVRSPVYSTFNEALHGAVTIRAFDAQPRMLGVNHQQVGMLQRANLTALALQQWLALRLQCLAAIVVTAVALLGVLQHKSYLPAFLSHGSRLFGAGAVGLSLSYALPLTGLLNGLLTSSAETEQEMVAVERVLEYSSVEPEALVRHEPIAGGIALSPSTAQEYASWPSSGEVIIQDALLRYKPGSPPALAGVSLHIQSGQKVGICGRTGAGKSSMLGAILRMTDLDSGSIHISNINICHVPLMRLRRAVAYIPQTAFLFQGTIRSNLDPMGRHTDRELIAALKQVHLWDVLCGLSLSHAKAEQSGTAAATPKQLAGISIASSGPAAMPGGTPPRSPRIQGPRSPSRLRPGPELDDAGRSPASNNGAPGPSSGRMARSESGSSSGRPISPRRSGHMEEGRHADICPIPRNLAPVLTPPPKPPQRRQGPPGTPTSLARFCNTLWSNTLASEAPSVLVHSGIGGQLLSLKLGEHGAGLSQGQQQLLAVARVLLRRPHVVLLDECSASVDRHVAAQMQDALRSHLADSTIIQVAHRISTVMGCDMVAVMEAGRVVEVGTPEALLHTPGSAFAALHAAEQGSQCL